MCSAAAARLLGDYRIPGADHANLAARGIAMKAKPAIAGACGLSQARGAASGWAPSFTMRRKRCSTGSV